MKHNGVEHATVGIGGHGCRLRKGELMTVDEAGREFLARRGLRTTSEIAQSARSLVRATKLRRGSTEAAR